LPSEEEWEFAARSGNNDYFYPWGKQWTEQAANVASKSPQAVGSYPSGASAQGILDLIGNVYEWTSSQASVYPGNQHAMNCDPKDKIIRGGCYANQVSGKDSVTATSRRCANPKDKSECLGFRLVTGK
jgi:formylglycine-generating enzyme required for sulfatase activity